MTPEKVTKDYVRQEVTEELQDLFHKYHIVSFEFSNNGMKINTNFHLLKDELYERIFIAEERLNILKSVIEQINSMK